MDGVDVRVLDAPVDDVVLSADKTRPSSVFWGFGEAKCDPTVYGLVYVPYFTVFWELDG